MNLKQFIQSLNTAKVVGGIALLALIVVLVQQVVAAPQVQGGGSTLEASGIIQAEDVAIASEFGGLITEIPVAEAEGVAKGDVLVQLDTALLDAKIEAANALVAMAEAGLAQAKAGARPGERAIAEAQLAQVEAYQTAAARAVADTQAMIANPQEIDLQIAVTQAQIESAEHQIAKAAEARDAAETGMIRAKAAPDEGLHRFTGDSGNVGDLPEEVRNQLPAGDGTYPLGDGVEIEIDGGQYTYYKWVDIVLPNAVHLAPISWWQTWIGVNSAAAQKDGYQAQLEHLYERRSNPQTLLTKADEARSAKAQSEAQVSMAEAQVSAMEAGATAEQIKALEARVAQAKTARDSLVRQREMLTLKAPLAGTVVDIVTHPGEIASPGAEILTLADLTHLTLTVYVPENRIGQINLGTPVQVKVDSFPGRIFEGEVVHIASSAEFTPRNVATQEERINLVFAVDIRLTNEDGVLKPGMPADVFFAE